MTTATKMPKGVMPLYIIQALSTFSYAILYSSLSLYITKQLGLSNAVSNSVVGLFLALNYVLHVLGGVIGGSYLSNRNLFFTTTIIQTIGIACLAVTDTSMLYLGLSLFLIGCGLNTTCYNTILTYRFAADDNRRDKAFFYSYAAMNVGFFAGYIFSGFYDYSNQYQQPFYLSIIMNVVTLLFMAYSWANLADKDTPLQEIKNPAQKQVRTITGIVGILLLIPLLMLCFSSVNLSNSLVVLTSLVMFVVIFVIGMRQKVKIDKQKIMAFLILTITSIVFWMIYFTGPMGITLFIKNNVDKHFFNYELATQWISNINSFVIVFGAPLMAIVLQKLQDKGYNFSVSMQFTWSFIFLALSFFFLTCGIHFANTAGFSGINWTILHLTTQAIAELLIGPVGYAMIGRIVPTKLQGLLMGTWMMVSGVSASLAQYFSNLMTKTDAVDPLLTNGDYQHVFNQLGVWALIGAIGMYFIAKRINSIIENTAENDAMVATA